MRRELSEAINPQRDPEFFVLPNLAVFLASFAVFVVWLPISVHWPSLLPSGV